MPMKLLSQKYGKSRVRVMKVLRDGATHSIKELDASVLLSGDFDSSYTAPEGDNSKVVATDTMKNTVNVLAHQYLGAENERFAQTLARHFLSHYEPVAQVIVELKERVWGRMNFDGKSHPHSFVQADNAQPFTRLTVNAAGQEFESGIRNLLILKSAESGFEGYPRCEFTTLPETKDRIFATSLEATWRWAGEPADYAAANAAIVAAMLKPFAGKLQSVGADDAFPNGHRGAGRVRGNPRHHAHHAEQAQPADQSRTVRPRKSQRSLRADGRALRIDRGDHHSLMTDALLAEWLAARERREPCVLATVAATKGSVPREAGAKALIFSDGRISGTVGGGKFESLVIADAQAAMSAKAPVLKMYPLHEASAESFGAICGGEVTMLLEPQLVKEALVIVGAGHCGRALCRLARECGWHVTVLDDRENLLAACEAHVRLRTPAPDFISQREWRNDDALVMVSRNFEVDREALAAALARAPAGYIGMIGSERKVRRVFDDLRTRGVSAADLARVFAPIGLDFGADSPAEVAISIFAEMLRVLRGRSGRHLRMDQIAE